MKTYISYLCIAAQRDIIRRYVNEGRAILYEYAEFNLQMQQNSD